MKKWVFCSTVAVSMLFAAACNSEPASEDEVSADESYSINIAYGNQPGEPIDQMAQKWEELAEEKSEGRLNLELYPSSQLGAERDVIEQAVMGNNVIVLAGYDGLIDYAPDAGVLNAPYLVDDMDQMLYLLTTDWYQGLKEELRANNVEVITNTAYGERHLMTKEKVTTPDDLKGMKIRVPDNNLSIETLNSMGAAATPTPLGDLYTSLQQGLVDGAENPIPVLHGAKTHEVAKHLTLTGHQTFVISWVGGSEFINTLPEDLVEILKETGDEASKLGRSALEEQTESVLQEFKDMGIEIHEIDTQPFKESVKDIYNDFPGWTPGLYDEIQAELEKMN